LEYFFCWKILAVTSLELFFVYICVHKRCICTLWNDLNYECALFNGSYCTSWILWRVCGVHTERWISWIVSRLSVHHLKNIRYFVFRVSNIYPLRGGSGVLCAGCVHRRRGGSGALYAEFMHLLREVSALFCAGCIYPTKGGSAELCVYLLRVDQMLCELGVYGGKVSGFVCKV
jgi:hypothetical protein